MSTNIIEKIYKRNYDHYIEFRSHNNTNYHCQIFGFRQMFIALLTLVRLLLVQKCPLGTI